LQQMVAEMVEADLETARAEVTLKANHPV
jgi:hypothetical protein